jgi:hypothetical protein
VQLDLTDEEVVALRDLLDAHLGDMSSEIAHTDSPKFRSGLRHLRDVLRTVRTKLGS